jgi:hypothetical protein
MTESMLDAVLKKAECEKDDKGVSRLPDGRTLTLYVAHEGTQLSVGKVVALRCDDALIETTDAKGETFLLSREDLFAASVAGAGKDADARKAGFIG